MRRTHDQHWSSYRGVHVQAAQYQKTLHPHTVRTCRRDAAHGVGNLLGRQVRRQLLGGPAGGARERAHGRVHLANLVRLDRHVAHGGKSAHVVRRQQQQVQPDRAAAGARERPVPGATDGFRKHRVNQGVRQAACNIEVYDNALNELTPALQRIVPVDSRSQRVRQAGALLPLAVVARRAARARSAGCQRRRCRDALTALDGGHSRQERLDGIGHIVKGLAEGGERNERLSAF